MVMKFEGKQDKEVSYNFGIHHIHRKHHYDYEYIPTKETVLAANIQYKQNKASPCSINKRAHKRVILVAPNIIILDQPYLV
jgi:hypothetical protein